MVRNAIIITVILALAAAVMPLTAKAATAAGNGQPDKPGAAADLSGADFMADPVGVLGQIYRDYHDWNLDRGIKTATGALKQVDGMYARNPNSTIDDPKLKLNKAYQLKSTLHTLLGMLYYRKAALGTRDGAFDGVLEKLKDGREITEADLNSVAAQAESSSNDYFAEASKELGKASRTDPMNPSPHFQLASIYSSSPDGADKALAETEYYMAAKLSYQEGNIGDTERALQAIKELNPSSPHIREVEGLMKGESY